MPSPKQPDPNAGLWGCLAVPLVLALLIYAVWPSQQANDRWAAIAANLSEPSR
jgi:hypothetical protein